MTRENLKKKTRFIWAWLALSMIGGIFFASPALCAGVALKAEGAGFDSPEGAARAYLEGLRDSELRRMISAFAIESYVENYDFEAQLNRMKSYHPGQEVKLPNANEFVTALNVEGRRSRVNDMILGHHFSLCISGLDRSKAQALKDETDARGFVAQLNANLNAPKFSTLKILGFIPPEAFPSVYSTPRNLEVMARMAIISGAKSLVSRVAVFTLDGNEYVFCFDAINYGGKWYISSLGGNIGALMGISVFSMGTVPVTTEMRDEIHKVLVPVE